MEDEVTLIRRAFVRAWHQAKKGELSMVDAWLLFCYDYQLSDEIKKGL